MLYINDLQYVRSRVSAYLSCKCVGLRDMRSQQHRKLETIPQNRRTGIQYPIVGTSQAEEIVAIAYEFLAITGDRSPSKRCEQLQS